MGYTVANSGARKGDASRSAQACDAPPATPLCRTHRVAAASGLSVPHSGEAEKQIQRCSYLARTGQISAPCAPRTIFLFALGEQCVLEIRAGQEEKNGQTNSDLSPNPC